MDVSKLVETPGRPVETHGRSLEAAGGTCEACGGACCRRNLLEAPEHLLETCGGEKCTMNPARPQLGKSFLTEQFTLLGIAWPLLGFTLHCLAVLGIA